MQIKEASIKWGISERRIRELIYNGRISGAKKVGNSWFIPDDSSKPMDKRVKCESDFTFNLPENYFYEIDKKIYILNSKRPFKSETEKAIKDAIDSAFICNSNGIHGNTLTLKETKTVLSGITVAGKSIKEHIEVINYKDAIMYLENLLRDDMEITEGDIKEVHRILLKGIDYENSGKYIDDDSALSMEKFLSFYSSLNDYHPIIKASILCGELMRIHPFKEGNGRIGRLLMNMELMKYGYTPSIITKDDKVKYYEILDKASSDNDYTDFIKMVSKNEEQILDMYLDVVK